MFGGLIILLKAINCYIFRSMMKPDIEANTFKDNDASRASISEDVRRFSGSGGVDRRDEGSDQPVLREGRRVDYSSENNNVGFHEGHPGAQ